MSDVHDHPAPPALTLIGRERGDAPACGVLTLPFEARQRSRLRVRLDDGREAALMLPRGEVLRGGDRLRSAAGDVVAVRAAAESLSEVRADDPLALARAAYHLGNRHVAVQVAAGWLRYLHDHVLDDMLRGLGLDVGSVHAAFEPEAGAYGGHHHHGHAHDHDGGDAHAHGHRH